MRRYLRYLLLFPLFACAVFPLRADEGMWIPALIGKNIKDMQAQGFKLTAEDLYSVNRASLKDAVVLFGVGCTGAVVSPQGLLLTNHHCGYGDVQGISTLENDYLTHGYSARNLDEELPCPGLSVRFLDYMEDVTSQLLKGVTEKDSEKQRQEKINANQTELLKQLNGKNANLTYDIKPLFYGNQYFVYAYRIYSDVRLVVAPPSQIGKFGGDSDNWDWPRHTGDYMLFRIYATADNEPAHYSKNNVPYRPRKHFTISTKGVGSGDFALAYGYPGTTKRYLAWQAVDEIMSREDPRKVALREERLEVIDGFMKQNDTIKLKYSNKYVSISNAWKKWIGEAGGLQRLDAVGVKQQAEKEFTEWVNGSRKRRRAYGHIMPAFDSIYRALEPLGLAFDFYNQGLMGIESLAQCISLIRHSERLLNAGDRSAEALEAWIKERAAYYFKDYDPRVDRGLMQRMLEAYRRGVPKELRFATLTPILASDDALSAFIEEVFSRSIFTSESRFKEWLAEDRSAGANRLRMDPLYRLAEPLRSEYRTKVSEPRSALLDKLTPLYRLYVHALQEMKPRGLFFADANLTLRIAYGKVEGFSPREAVYYDYYTTLDGVMEKKARGNHDYQVPERLEELYKEKDYGQWAHNGSVPVCFAASIHTTGGNSGSPVLNANGELLGLNFDRVWEGTMSDVMFDPERCRNISVDVRYILFLIDKYADASYLFKEMTFAR